MDDLRGRKVRKSGFPNQNFNNMIRNQFNPHLPNYVAKDILSFQEAVAYLDLSESSLYKLTSDSKITFFKPNGGKLYFKKVHLDQWMLQNECKHTGELENDILSKMNIDEK